MLIQVHYFFSGIKYAEADDKIITEIQKISEKIYVYHKEKGSIPASLLDVNFSKSELLFPQEYELVYQATSNKKSFRIAARVSYPFIIAFTPEWTNNNSKSTWCCSTYALRPDYLGFRNGHPVYRKSEFFKNDLNEWPIVSTNNTLQHFTQFVP